MTEAVSHQVGSVSSEQSGGLFLSAWCLVAAFGTYFCMYAFRKPFTAATYTDTALWGIGYKTVLVTAQVLGYTLSKFLGIKVIAELPPTRRAALLLLLIGGAQAALLLFGLTPAPYNFVWLFFNGVPLGMVFGLVLGFLEGRLQTEALAAGLCTSFVVADGVTKSVGASLLVAGVVEFWMPFVAGLLFVPPQLLFVWMLTRIPTPSPQDIAARSERAPMDRHERWRFLRRYAVGLTLLVAIYVLITVLRSVRADFAPEIWQGLLGHSAEPGLFTNTEIVVAVGVLVLNGSAVLIRNNRRAFFAALALVAGGAALMALALVGFQARGLSPLAFMVLLGLGLYLPYIAVQTTIFERLLAMTRHRGNIGYPVYLADAFGYLGYVGVMLARNAVKPADSFLAFFLALSWTIAAACVVLLVPCWYYFATHPATRVEANVPDSDQPCPEAALLKRGQV
jgi:hypothetical protein